MRWILLGVVLGLLLLYPSLLAVVAAAVATIVSKPIVVAFGLGLAARPAIARRTRRWVA
ncbi:hypothetical protein ABZ835_37750 [Streptomyces sp. NPDC047461]|uniref:hypothetical protein n=1 Tax=Streptomyces sp. NPDC047461 TaxID=3155619 RepID=UPI0033F5B9BD